MRRLILWDIDGTLVRSGGVGAEVFDLAVERVLGTRPPARVHMSGKTDRQIVEEYLDLAGHLDPALVPVVLGHLEEELAGAAGRIATEGHVCAGVEDVLAALAAVDSVEQTVLTGNIAPNARAKVAAFGLDRYLDLEAGAYGADHSDRRDLLPLAWRHQRELRGVDYRADETWIIGDTPNDLACARSGGAHCLLAATGSYEAAELDALGADLVLTDLRDTARVIDALIG